MSSQVKQMTADTVRAVEWDDNQNRLKLLDQRRLPLEVAYLTLETAEEVAAAIHDMVVRGAPAIGIAAAYGTVLAAQQACKHHPKDWRQVVEEKFPVLLNARPTAVNLLWAIRRMQAVLERHPVDPVSALLAEARTIHREDITANQQMGRIGAEYLRNNHGVLTHCNTGSLATGGYGTALGVIRTAFAAGLVDHVYASETRPWLQGGRLTVWELQQDRIPVTLVADSTSAWLMQSGKISWVITGADRIAANGDVANKIGTYAHAVHARYHGIGFMVVAPFSTVDPDTPSGADIVVEEREAGELIEIAGKKIAPANTRVYNPVFDITPAELVSVLVTERGAVEAPDSAQIRRLAHWKK